MAMDAERFTLPSGLKVLLLPNHATKVVAFQAWVGVGSADEPEALAGIAHVFEHMLFKGTRRRKVGEIAQEVEGAGGEINAWTSFDQTVYHLVIASRYFDTGLDILADALQHSSFEPHELERELKVVLEEVKQGEDNPSRVATQAVFSTAFTRHPYRRPVIGYSKTVRSFTRPRLIDFFRRNYVADNVTFVAVGDFDASAARAKISAAFQRMARRPASRRAPKHSPARRARPVEPVQRAPRAHTTTQDVREVHLQLAFHVPGIGHPDVPALDVLGIVLGQGDSSRLVSRVRRDAQVVSDVYTYSYTPRDPGLLVSGATLPPERLNAALDAILGETFLLCHEPVSAEELDKAKTIIESDAIFQKETVQGLARKLGFFESVAGGLEAEAEYLRAVREVSTEQLLEVAPRYLKAENATVSVLAPREGKWPSAAQLKARVTAADMAARSRARSRPARQVGGSGEVIRVALPEGAKLLVQRDASVGVVALRAVWMGGQRFEDEQTAGINNLLAGLLTRGTRSLSGDALAREIEGMAGAIGGFSGRNSFGVRAELLGRHFDRGLELFSECVLAPTLAPEELERERRQVLEEIRTQEDNVSASAFRLFAQTLYREHPYRLDAIGTAESVAGLSRDKLALYHRRHVRPSDMTLAIVGDVDPQAVIARVHALFPAGAGPAVTGAIRLPRVEEPPPGPLEVFRSQNKQQAHVVYGFPGTTVANPDRFALELLSTVLSGQGGRLFVELRDRRGLAYRVSAFSVEGVDPGYFAVYIATSPENLAVALAGIREELDKVMTRPIPKAELDRAKRYLVGAHEISLQRRAAIASTLAFHECYGLGWDEYRRYAPAILAVSAADVRDAARRYLDPARSVVATVRPEEGARALALKAPGAAKAARTSAARAPLRRR
jgi:zinc protease